MHIPEPLYRKLPVIYAMTGLALVALFGLSVPIAISAFMLLCAAGLTVLWRHRYQVMHKAGLDHRAQWARRRHKRAEDMLSR